VSGSGISWAICKSASRSRQITMPALHHSVFLQARCPSCRPTNSINALKAKCNINKGKKFCCKNWLQLQFTIYISFLTVFWWIFFMCIMYVLPFWQKKDIYNIAKLNVVCLSAQWRVVYWQHWDQLCFCELLVSVFRIVLIYRWQNENWHNLFVGNLIVTYFVCVCIRIQDQMDDMISNNNNPKCKHVWT